jgi:long-chain acyl-CoA synthetase
VIRDHIADQLAKYKRPADITILDDLPRNPVGKIDKPTLRRLLADSLANTSTNGS